MTALTDARAKLREQLDWRGPNGRPQGILTLSREEAEDILAGLTGQGGVTKPTYRQFVCKSCGADCMTSYTTDFVTCRACYHRDQPNIKDWMKT